MLQNKPPRAGAGVISQEPNPTVQCAAAMNDVAHTLVYYDGRTWLSKCTTWPSRPAKTKRRCPCSLTNAPRALCIINNGNI